MSTRPLIIFCILICFLSSYVCWATNPQQEKVKNKAQSAINLPFPKAANESRRRLRQLGAPAIPYVLQAIESDGDMNPIKKTFLVDVIASIHHRASVSALIELLSSKDAYLRGLAARYVGKRKVRRSLPKLMDLLGDKEVYKTSVYTDPSSEKPILVRDAAIEALQTITGSILAPKGTKEQQADAWLRWWQAQQKRKQRRSLSKPHFFDPDE